MGNVNGEGCKWLTDELNKPSPIVPRNATEKAQNYIEEKRDGFPYNTCPNDVTSSIKLEKLKPIGSFYMHANDDEIVGNSVAIINNKKEIVGCAPIFPARFNYWVASKSQDARKSNANPDEGNVFVIASLPCSQLRIISDIDLCINSNSTEVQQPERSMHSKWTFAKDCNAPVQVPSEIACGVFVNTIRKPMDITNDGRYDLDNEHRYVIIWPYECDAAPICLELKKTRPWQFSSTLLDITNKTLNTD